MTETTTLLETESVQSDPTPETVESQAPETTPVAEPPGWTAGLKSEQKSNEYFHKFSKVSEFAEEHLKMKERLEKSVAVPNDEASEEELNEFYQRLGRPEAPDKYDLPAKVGDFKVPDDFRSSISDVAFKLGLTAKQAKGFYEAQVQQYKEIAAKGAEEYKMALQDGEKALKKEWRTDYSANLDVAKRGYKEFVDKEVAELINVAGIGNHPALLKLFHRIGQKLTADRQVQGEPPAKGKSEFVVSYKSMK